VAISSFSVSAGRAAIQRIPRRLHRSAPLGLVAMCTLVVIVVALPIPVTIAQASQGGIAAAVKAILATSPRVLLNSALVTVLAAPVTAFIGVSCAWFVERTAMRGRRVWTMLLVAPITMPLFVTSYAWAALGRFAQGLLGAVGIIAFSYYPIVFLLVAASLRGMDPALEESARSLGLGAWRTFFRVVLPQLRPALLGGVLLVVLDTLVEFDAFVALKFQSFSGNVFAQYQLSFSSSGAAALSFISIAMCTVLLIGEVRLRGGANYTRVGHGARRAPVPGRLGRATPLVLLGLALVVAIGLGIPLGALVSWFTQSSHAGLASASTGLRFLGRATLTSVALGVGSALLALALALPVALLAVRHRGRISTTLERATYLSFALPDLVAATALAYAASHYVPSAYESAFLLVFADAILFVPFAVVALRATIGQIEPALEDSARSLGTGLAGTFRRVTLPLARPGLAAAGVLVFAFVLGDLSTAEVLLPPGLYTLGTAFAGYSASVAFAAAAPYAAVLVALSMLATYVVMSRFGRVRVREER
jgi:iron(III) transport system permease protein